MNALRLSLILIYCLTARFTYAQITTYTYTGSMVTYTVPVGVTSIEIETWGAQGGSTVGLNGASAAGGLGGYSHGELAVIPGQVLQVFVGGQGGTHGAGGFNGGGQAGTNYGAAGGGASDVRIGPYGLANRILVAGGGGGGSFGTYGHVGGAGGGLNGLPGASGNGFTAGGGGTQVSGGTAGCCYPGTAAGTFGFGGGTGAYHNAGGGGGWYGGGSGAGYAGAGGGSSYIGGVIAGATSTGVRSGNGLVVITVLCDPLTATVSTDELCFGEELILDATSVNGGTITWDGGAIDGLPFTPASSGIITYTATSDDLGDCWLSVAVEVFALPTVIAEVDDTAICFGESVIFSNLGDADTYTWDPVEVSSGVPYSPEVGLATYVLTGTNTTTGCLNTSEISVEVYEFPTILGGVDLELCIGDSIVLAGDGAGVGGSYSWDGGILDDVYFEPLLSGSYIVTGTDANGCLNRDTVDVIVHALPSIDAGLNDTICFGAAVTLTGAGLVDPAGYSWSDGISDAVAFTPAVTNLYFVVGIDENGCVNTDSVLVFVNALPLIEAGADQSVCFGLGVTLAASGGGFGASYDWTDPVENGVEFSPVSTAMYYVTGTDLNGCENGDSLEVIVFDLPLIEAGDSVEICIGDSTVLAGDGAGIDGTYTWDGGIIDNVYFEPFLSEWYVLIGSDSNGCLNTDSVYVTVNLLPLIDAGLNDTICYGDEAILTASGLVDPLGYSWSDGISDAIAFTPVFTNLYFVVGTDENGCVNADSVLVFVHDLPIIEAGADQAVCFGTGVTLSADGAGLAGIYDWSDAIENGVEFTPVSTSIYHVTGTDFNGCQNIDSLEVVVFDLPLVDAGADFAICIGDSATLIGSGAGPDGVYTWNEGVEDGVTFYPTVTSEYVVIGEDENGCLNTDTISITVNDLPIIFAGDDLLVCANEFVTLLGSGAGIGGIYSWNNGVFDGVSFIPLDADTFVVVGTDENGCINTDSLTISLKAVPFVNGGEDQRICLENEIILAVIDKEPTNSYAWDKGVVDGVAFIGYTEQYEIFTVTAVNSEGCKNTDEVLVEVINCDTILIHPTGFSPNNDGVNDYLVFSGIPLDLQIYLAVYNEWGMLLFESADYQNNWDGTNELGMAFNKGTALPAGTYYYILQYGDEVVKNYLQIER